MLFVCNCFFFFYELCWLVFVHNLYVYVLNGEIHAYVVNLLLPCVIKTISRVVIPIVCYVMDPLYCCISDNTLFCAEPLTFRMKMARWSSSILTTLDRGRPLHLNCSLLARKVTLEEQLRRLVAPLFFGVSFSLFGGGGGGGWNRPILILGGDYNHFSILLGAAASNVCYGYGIGGTDKISPVLCMYVTASNTCTCKMFPFARVHKQNWISFRRL